jgi:hypothetical protein
VSNPSINACGQTSFSNTTRPFSWHSEEKAKKSIFNAFCSSNSTVGMAVSMELLGSLHPAGIAPKCEQLFDQHGYAPLNKFYAMEGGFRVLISNHGAFYSCAIHPIEFPSCMPALDCLMDRPLPIHPTSIKPTQLDLKTEATQRLDNLGVILNPKPP